jgi:hypothetical protein
MMNGSYRWRDGNHPFTVPTVRFGSLAAGSHPRPSTSAFAHKADTQAGEIIGLAMAANGHKLPLAVHNLSGSFRPARLTLWLTGAREEGKPTEAHPVQLRVRPDRVRCRA